MTPAELDVELNELELRLERLRALYEQYFTGIERIAPAVVRKDVDRRVWVLRREKIRNTAKRFKLQTIIQRYNTYQQYWGRICREMENGTYRRHKLRAERRFGAPAAVTTHTTDTNEFVPAAEDLELDDELDVDADTDQEFADDADRTSERAPDTERSEPDSASERRAASASTKPAARPPPRPAAAATAAASSAEARARRAAAGLEHSLAQHLDGFDVDAEFDSALDAAFGFTAARPEPLAPRAAVPEAPRRAPPATPQPAAPDSGHPASGPPRLKPPPRRAGVGLGSAPPALPRRSAGPVPPPLPQRPATPIPERAQAPVQKRSNSVRAVPPEPVGAAPAPPLPARMGAAPAPPRRAQAPTRQAPATAPPQVTETSPAAAPAAKAPAPPRPAERKAPPQPAERKVPPQPAAPPQPEPAGVSRQRIQDLHRELMAAQRSEHEPSTVSEQALAKSIRQAEQKLREKHGDRPIDFSVVVKNGKAVLKPVVH